MSLSALSGTIVGITRLAELKSHVVERSAYNLGGLCIASDFPLFGLQICLNGAVQHEVVIRRASIPKELASKAATFSDGQCIGSYNGNEVLLEFPTAGRFLVRSGKEILVDPSPASDDGEVRSYLLGTAFGVLCHQRGITPLHAAVIDVPGGCIAFVGPSGAGKSTLVAALAQRGYPVISDDVCFLRLGTWGRRVQAWPGMTRIRLWEDARAALGYDGPEIEREMRGYNKYVVPVLPLQDAVESRRLLRVYELHAAVRDTAEVIRLRGTVAIEVLMQNVYRLGLAELLGYKPRAFSVCAAAARDVQVFRFRRPRGFDALSHGLDLLESHIRELG